MGSCCSTTRVSRPRPNRPSHVRRPVAMSTDPVQQFLELRAALRSEFRQHNDSDTSSSSASSSDEDSALDALAVLLVLLQQQQPRSAPLSNMAEVERTTTTEMATLSWIQAQHDVTCTICLCDVEAGTTVRHLPCGHTFHQKCIDAWLTTQQWTVCPNCRQDPRTRACGNENVDRATSPSLAVSPPS